MNNPSDAWIKTKISCITKKEGTVQLETCGEALTSGAGRDSVSTRAGRSVVAIVCRPDAANLPVQPPCADEDDPAAAGVAAAALHLVANNRLETADSERTGEELLSI